MAPSRISHSVLRRFRDSISWGRVGDSYDNALAETIIGLFKTEIIRPRGPWCNLDQVEYATLEWVDWFNNRRLLGPIGAGAELWTEDRRLGYTGYTP